MRALCFIAVLALLAFATAAGAQDIGLAHAEGESRFITKSLAEEIYGPYYPIVLRLFHVIEGLLVLLAVAVPLQLLLPAVKRKPKVTTYEYWLDVIYYFQGPLLALVSFEVLVELLVYFFYSPNNPPWLPQAATLPIWLQVIIGVWLYDFIVYWRHRLEHTFSPLWSFHAVHHTTQYVDVLTTTRLHPIELVLGAVTNYAASRVGFSEHALGIAFTIYLYWNYFIHANVRIRAPGFLKYIFVTPFNHHWHHADDPASIGKNVGVVFAWNDWLFRTAYLPDHWPKAYGLTVEPREAVPQSYLRQVLYPLQYAYVKISDWMRRRRPSKDPLP